MVLLLLLACWLGCLLLLWSCWDFRLFLASCCQGDGSPQLALPSVEHHHLCPQHFQLVGYFLQLLLCPALASIVCCLLLRLLLCRI